MLLTLVSDNYSQGNKPNTLKLILKCPSGQRIPFVFEYTIDQVVLSKALFHEVESVTGIPQDLQMLAYKAHLMNPNTPLHEY